MTKVLLLATCVYAGVFGVVALLLRAGKQGVVGALAGGVLASLAGAMIEGIAHWGGLWEYTEHDTAFGPVLLYPLNVIIFALIALIGWGIGRRWGTGAQALFVGASAVMSVPGDYVVTLGWLHLVRIGPGVSLPVLAMVDIAAWSVLSTIALVVMQTFWAWDNFAVRGENEHRELR